METDTSYHLTVLDYHSLLRHSSSSSPPHSLPPDPTMLGRHSMVEGRPHLCQDDGLRTRGDLKLRDDSSSMSAEGVKKNGSNFEILQNSFFEFRVDDVATSSESEAALAVAKERESLVAEVMSALGPGGAGLLAVRGVPGVATLRQRLLPLAKKLALMRDATRRPVLQNHGLSTDVPLKRPDRQVSAFATKLQHARHSHNSDGACNPAPLSQPSPGCLCDVSYSKHPSRTSDDSVSREQSELEQLGGLVRQLGACMVEVGLWVARLCDSAIPGAHLEAAIWESGSVKARLIHYHAHSEQDILATHSEKMRNGFRSKGTSRPSKIEVEGSGEPSSEELWQEWHYDYGILTVLTDPMFLGAEDVAPGPPSGPECGRYPGGHTGLRVLSRGVDGFVSVPSDCLIVQVGEAAQIASGGRLGAVAHCVCRPPPGGIDMSRETFVTFLQPAWDRVLRPPTGVTRAEVLNLGVAPKSRTANANSEESEEDISKEERAEPQEEDFFSREASVRSNRFSDLRVKLLNVVPSLASRWDEGCTFAEFSRQTTGQYYGAKGSQSRRIGHPSMG